MLAVATPAARIARALRRGVAGVPAGTVRPVAASTDTLDTPLHRVTFCVVDVETTGGSPQTCAITEVGAARYRGGERLGTFRTLVDPGVPIPPTVTVLTGITEAMVTAAPRLAEVLPSLLEFVGGSVLVGHNLRFDAAFLDAGLASAGRGRLGHHRVDTVALARRLLAEEVPDCTLGTLAAALQLPHRPTHRALDDVLATADLLHVLLERAGTFGATTLDDLLVLPQLTGHRHAGKLRLTTGLPRRTGVYVLRDRQGQALHIGAAADVRRRVRATFAGRDERRTGALLRGLHSVDHVPCASMLAAAVVRSRLAPVLQPRYDRRPAGWRAARHVVLAPGPAARLTVTRSPRPAAIAVGPVPSTAAGRQVVAAVQAAVPPGRPEAAATVALGVGVDPAVLLDPLAARVREQAAAGDGEGAEATRAAAVALATALTRRRRHESLRRAGRLVVASPDGTGVELVRGTLVRAWPAGAEPPPVVTAGGDGPAPGGPSAGDPGVGGPGMGGDPHLVEPVAEPPPAEGPTPLDRVDELDVVAAWLARHAHRVRLVHAEHGLASPWPPVPAVPPVPRPPDPGPLRSGPCSLPSS